MFVNSLFISFLRIVVSPYHQTSYVNGGRPARPKCLPANDLRQLALKQ